MPPVATIVADATTVTEIGRDTETELLQRRLGHEWNTTHSTVASEIATTPLATAQSSKAPTAHQQT